MFYLIMRVRAPLLCDIRFVGTRLCAGLPLGYAVVNSIEETTYCLFPF